uniref:Distal membrane-arm assembly complex protein 2 n=1 Tax=Salarias fasciatus TaxID=181472 RepID=A0A672J1W6_SALFA
MLLYLKSQLSRDQLRKKNAYYGYTERYYGKNIASAYFILRLKGGFRFVGQSEWYRADWRGRFSWDFLQYKDTQMEEVDMSHTVITYSGLQNLKVQKSLRTLKLQGCPEVDDWFLAGLHIFQDCLEELDISHCPCITTGGLAALRNLKGLKRLDISSLPKISSPGLVVILLEEMLPNCLITANGYKFSPVEIGGVEEEVEKGVEKAILRRR